MTLNVTVLTKRFAACVTDRRLSAPTKVSSERARKLIQIDTGPFKGLICYNGIGRSIEGETPNDWVAEAHLGGQWTLLEFCERLKAISEPRIRALAPQFAGNPRHTFVLVGYDSLTPVIGTLSNYEGMGQGQLNSAGEQLEVDLRTPRPEAPFGLVITGATNIMRRRSCEGLVAALRGNADRQIICSKMVKVIRDTAYRDRIGGSVGSGTLSSIYDVANGFEAGGDAVGGSHIHDVPDALMQGAQFRDIWVTGEYKPISTYDKKAGKFVEHELPCPKCGIPVPDGQRRCSGCDHRMKW